MHIYAVQALELPSAVEETLLIRVIGEGFLEQMQLETDSTTEDNRNFKKEMAPPIAKGKQSVRNYI